MSKLKIKPKKLKLIGEVKSYEYTYYGTTYEFDVKYYDGEIFDIEFIGIIERYIENGRKITTFKLNPVGKEQTILKALKGLKEEINDES